MCEDSSSPHVRKCKAFFSSQYLKSKCLKTLQEFQPLLQLKDDLDEHFFGCYIYCAAGSDQWFMMKLPLFVIKIRTERASGSLI